MFVSERSSDGLRRCHLQHYKRNFDGRRKKIIIKWNEIKRNRKKTKKKKIIKIQKKEKQKRGRNVNKRIKKKRNETESLQSWWRIDRYMKGNEVKIYSEINRDRDESSLLKYWKRMSKRRPGGNARMIMVKARQKWLRWIHISVELDWSAVRNFSLLFHFINSFFPFLFLFFLLLLLLL